MGFVKGSAEGAGSVELLNKALAEVGFDTPSAPLGETGAADRKATASATDPYEHSCW